MQIWVKIQIWGQNPKIELVISDLRSQFKILGQNIISEVTIQNLRSKCQICGQKILLSTLYELIFFTPEPIIAVISVFGLQSCRFLCRLTSIKISNSALFEFSFINSKGKSDVDSNEFPGFFEDLIILIKIIYKNFSKILFFNFLNLSWVCMASIMIPRSFLFVEEILELSSFTKDKSKSMFKLKAENNFWESGLFNLFYRNF